VPRSPRRSGGVAGSIGAFRICDLRRRGAQLVFPGGFAGGAGEIGRGEAPGGTKDKEGSLSWEQRVS